MDVETLDEIRERMEKLSREIEEEIGETEKPLHAEAAMQEFPRETRSKAALYRKLRRAKKLLTDAEENPAEAEEKMNNASKILKQEDQAHISDESYEELKDLAEDIEKEREENPPRFR